MVSTHMMTSSNENIFRVTGHLCGEITGDKGQWRRSLIFSLICTCVNGRANNREAGDFRRHRSHDGMIYRSRSWLHRPQEKFQSRIGDCDDDGCLQEHNDDCQVTYPALMISINTDNLGNGLSKFYIVASSLIGWAHTQNDHCINRPNASTLLRT